MECDVDCDADLILGYDWLRSHGLAARAFLYDTNEMCICAERDCISGRRVRLDLALDGPASPATRLSLAEARELLGAVGLGPASTLGRPSQWSTPSGGSATAAAIQAAAAVAGTADTLAGLAETGTTLADGTELFVGRIAFAAEGPACNLPPDDGDPPDFAALAGEYADVLAGPPPGLPPDRGPAFELRIDVLNRLATVSFPLYILNMCINTLEFKFKFHYFKIVSCFYPKGIISYESTIGCSRC